MPTADLSRVRLYYELSGVPSADVIVLSNSLGSNLHMWDRIAPGLEKKLRVLRYDSRGHGRSSVPPAPYSITELGNDLVELLNHLQIESVHFCGLSLGGLVGMRIGINEPQRIKHLILANTAARIGTRQLWDERIADIRKSGMEPLATATLGRWFTEEFRRSRNGDLDTIRTMFESTPVEGYIGSCLALRDADLRVEVGAIRARTLVITGTHDPATPPEDGRWLHAAVQDSLYVELASAHLSAWERAGEFQRAVIDFLG
jgi:3-oxoadipate enol-lactonase